MDLNLDEARVARREEAKEAPTVTFGGRTFTLPVELPIEAVDALAELAAATRSKNGMVAIDSLRATIRAMLTDEEYEAFMGNKPSANDLVAVVDAIPEMYGLALPESSGLPEPSETTTASSKRRSAKPTS